MRKLKRKGQSIFAVMLAVVLAASCLLYTGGAEVQAATPESDFEFDSGVITGYSGSDTDVVIPSTIGGEAVTKIAWWAFNGKSLTSVTIPSSVTTIEEGAFYECDSLEEVTFEGKVDDIENNAFQDCAYVINFHCQKRYESYYEDLLMSITNYGATLETFGDSGSTEPTEPEDPKADAKDIFGLVEKDGGYVVTKYDVDKGGKDVVVPAEYNGKPIVAIGDNAFVKPDMKGYNDWVTSIELPSSITEIGNNAFYGCSRVSEIKIPEGVKTIGAEAFRYCNSLTEINIPASVTFIGSKKPEDKENEDKENENKTDVGGLAFKQAGGAHLKAINVAPENANYKSEDGVLFSKDGKTLICYPVAKVGNPYQMPDSVEVIANDALKGDPAGLFDSSTQDGTHKLTSIVFSKSLREIGERAFEQTNLESVTITSDIKIGKLAFAGCKKLTTVTIEDGVTEIPEAAFMNMENVVNLSLPKSLKTIGKQAFDRYGAASIDLPEGLETIGESAFASSKLTSVKIPSTVTTIGPRAFIYSHDLATVTFADKAKITSIGEYAFNHCRVLNDVEIPNSVTKLDNGCFSYCDALNNITVPNSVTELGNVVFAGSGLTDITLPDNITNMGMATFRACTSLKSVKMPKNLKTLGTCTFEDCSALTSVTFQEAMKLTYVPSDTFFNCKAIEKIYLPKVIAETKACAFSNCDMNPTIEYANADLKRNPFDCYAIDPGDAYRLGEDGFYYTTEGIDDSNFSEIVFGDIPTETNTNVNAKYDGSTVYGRSVSSAVATCGCGTGLGANAKLTPSSNPKFVYKGASSGTNAGSGSNNGNGSGNGNGSSIGTGSGKGNGSANANASTTGKKKTSPKVTGRVAAKTGDESFFGGYVVLLILALAAGAAVLVYRRKSVEQR